MSTMSPNNPIDLKSFESVNVTMDEKQTKEWEKTFKDDQKFNEFLTGSGTELLELFDATALDIKIKDVVDKALDQGRTDKLTNVDKAYLVLKALKDGKVGSYQELLTAEIQRIEIDIKKAKLEKVIDKDKTLSEVEKQVLREQLAEQAANATTVAEFEENYGVASGTIDAIKDVKNVVKMVLHALNPKTQFNIMKDMANIGIKMGMEVKEVIAETFNKAKESGIAAYNEMLDRVNEAGLATKDMFISLIDRGYMQWTDFGNRCTKNRNNAEQRFSEVANDLVESGKLALDTFSDFCAETRETTQNACEDFWKSYLKSIENKKDMYLNSWNILAETVERNRTKMGIFFETITNLAIEEGKLAWENVAEFCTENRETTKDFFERNTLRLIEEGKLAWNAVAEFCNTAWDTTKKTLEAMTLKLLIKGNLLIKDIGEFCNTAWETTSQFFSDVATAFLETLKNEKEKLISAWNEVVTWSKGAREVTKGVVLEIGKKLYESGVATLNVIANGLLIALGTMVLVGKFLVEGFKYVGQKLLDFGKAFVNVIYEAAEVIETALADAYNFVVDNITKVANVALDMINSARNDTKIVFNTLYALGKITMERGLNRLSMKYNNFVNMRNDIKNRGTIQLEKFTERVGNARQNIKERTKAFAENVQGFVNYLVEQGKYTIEQIGLFFVKTGENIKQFFNDMITLGAVTLQKVCDRFVKTYNTIQNAANKLFELGIGLWNEIGDIMYKAGIAMETIAKTIYKYAKIGADKICDFFYKFGNAVGVVVDVVGKAIKEFALQVQDRAYDVYSKTMSAVDAAAKAIEDAKERVGTQIDAVGDRLVSIGIGAKEIGVLMMEEFAEYSEQVEQFFEDTFDGATEWLADGFEDVSNRLRNLA